MKRINDVLHQLTDAAAIMQQLKETLREVDPSFRAEEERYEAACGVLIEKIGDSVTPSASDYLAALEAECAAALVYIGWQGFRLNLDIFESPVNALLLRGDFEDLHRERRLLTVPGVQEHNRTIHAFHDALRDRHDDQDLTDGISSFYTYLETNGYKLAHYFGFRLADGFLRHVIPGYTDDSVNTTLYKMALHDALGIDPDLLE